MKKKNWVYHWSVFLRGKSRMLIINTERCHEVTVARKSQWNLRHDFEGVKEFLTNVFRY